MSSSLGFKLSVAGGGTAATASAAAGGLYLSSSSDSSSTNDSLAIKKESPQTKQTPENLVDKKPSSPEVQKQTKAPTVTAIRNTYSKASEGSGLTTDTIGGRYYFFLAGTSIDQNVEQSTRESYIEWWNQKFSLWQQDKDKNNLDVNFQGIKQGYDDEDTKALNKVCEKVYKEKDPFEPDKANQISSRTVSNLEHNYWKYCSDLEEKPLSLTETGEDKGEDNSKIGHYNGYGHVLAATGTGYNNKYWELKQTWYESLVTTAIDSEFKTYAEGKGEAVKENNKVSLRKVCEKAKDLERESSSPKAEIIVKYCGLSEHLYKEDTQD